MRALVCREYGPPESVVLDEIEAPKPGKGVSVVYDPVGGELAEQALRVTGWHGRHLVIGFASGDITRFPANIALLKEISIIGVFWGQWIQADPEAQIANARELAGLVKDGMLRPQITATYDFSDYVQAYDDIAARRVTGKTVFRLR